MGNPSGTARKQSVAIQKNWLRRMRACILARLAYTAHWTDYQVVGPLFENGLSNHDLAHPSYDALRPSRVPCGVSDFDVSGTK